MLPIFSDCKLWHCTYIHGWRMLVRNSKLISQFDYNRFAYLGFSQSMGQCQCTAERMECLCSKYARCTHIKRSLHFPIIFLLHKHRNKIIYRIGKAHVCVMLCPIQYSFISLEPQHQGFFCMRPCVCVCVELSFFHRIHCICTNVQYEGERIVEVGTLPNQTKCVFNCTWSLCSILTAFEWGVAVLIVCNVAEMFCQ